MEKTEHTQSLEQDNPQEYFEPFGWKPRIKKHQSDYADFIEDVNFTTRGIETILELLESASLDRGESTALNKYQEGVLIRFAIVSCRTLTDRACELLLDIDERRVKQASKNLRISK